MQSIKNGNNISSSTQTEGEKIKDLKNSTKKLEFTR